MKNRVNTCIKHGADVQKYDEYFESFCAQYSFGVPWILDCCSPNLVALLSEFVLFSELEAC